jgi:chromosome condensin MukBEF complex kleisin-like MukF subunit
VAIRDLAGTGALQDTLGTTNTHLEAVLRELQELNNERLQAVVDELRTLTTKVDRLIEQGDAAG